MRRSNLTSTLLNICTLGSTIRLGCLTNIWSIAHNRSFPTNTITARARLDMLLGEKNTVRLRREEDPCGTVQQVVGRAAGRHDTEPARPFVAWLAEYDGPTLGRSTSMRTLGGEVVGGHWGRSPVRWQLAEGVHGRLRCCICLLYGGLQCGSLTSCCAVGDVSSCCSRTPATKGRPSSSPRARARARPTSASTRTQGARTGDSRGHIRDPRGRPVHGGRGSPRAAS